MINVLLHECPTCGAKEGTWKEFPCKTSKGRIRKSTHDTRKFSLSGMPSITPITQGDKEIGDVLFKEGITDLFKEINNIFKGGVK